MITGVSFHKEIEGALRDMRNNLPDVPLTAFSVVEHVETIQVRLTFESGAVTFDIFVPRNLSLKQAREFMFRNLAISLEAIIFG